MWLRQSAVGLEFLPHPRASRSENYRILRLRGPGSRRALPAAPDHLLLQLWYGAQIIQRSKIAFRVSLKV